MVVLVVIAFLASFVLPFTYWPEMLNWPFFVASGWAPYKDIAIVHTPFLVLLLTKFYQLLGWSPQTLHLFGTLLMVISVIVVKKIAGWLPAFLFLCFTFAFEGNTVWFESSLVPFLLLVYFFQIKFRQKPQNNRYIFWAGLFFGLALLAKQTAAYTLPVIAIYFWWLKFPRKAIFYFLLPIFLLTGLTFLWTVQQGITFEFLDWTIRFVFFKPFLVPARDSQFLLLPHPGQWAILLIYFFLGVFLARRHRDFKNTLAFLWMGAGFLFAFPRFGYFHLLPTIAFFSVLINRAPRAILILTVVLTSIVFLKNGQYIHTFLDNDTLALASYLKTNYPNRSLFVLNGADQLYFLTGRIPAVRPWVPQLPWYFEYYGDKRFLTDLKRSQPDVIVYAPYLSRPVDGLGAYQPAGVLPFLYANYDFVATVSATEIFRHQ